MNFSYPILKNILNSLLKGISIKKTYVQTLKDNIKIVLTLKRSKFREINFKLLKKSFKPNNIITKNFKPRKRIDNNLVVMYVVAITKTRSNFYLNIFNSIGKLMLTLSAGNLCDLSAIRRKAKGFHAINAIFKLIPKQKYLRGKPLALHIINKRLPRKLVRRLRKKKIVKCISMFQKQPFNGCRNKKLRSV
jgi:hypothetical protein